MTPALVRADHIHTLMLAHRWRRGALVHIDAAAVVAATDHKTALAAALHATVHHVALMLAAPVLERTQIVGLALPSVVLQRLPVRTRTPERTALVHTLVRTAPIGKVTLVNVNAHMPIVVQTEPGRTRATIRSGHILTRMRALRPAVRALIPILARPQIRAQIEALRTRALPGAHAIHAIVRASVQLCVHTLIDVLA